MDIETLWGPVFLQKFYLTHEIKGLTLSPFGVSDSNSCLLPFADSGKEFEKKLA